MAKQVVHLQLYKPGAFGGAVNTTLCGRVRNGQDYNSTTKREEVSCSFCLRDIARNAPRLRWEGWTPPD